MILKRISNKIRSATSQYHLRLLRLIVFCMLPFSIWAQNQNAVSNGAGMISGGNYTGYVSAGQMGTYLFASGNQMATQGIILNEISSETEFTFTLRGNLTVAETENLKSGELRLKSVTAASSGPPLSLAKVYLILVETEEVFAETTTDESGSFMFPNIPYKDFYFTVNTKEIPNNPVTLSFKINIFIQEVVISGEVGTEGVTVSVSITPVNGCDPEHPDYRIWYFDFDGDGFGDKNITVGQCTQPLRYVLNNYDCDDTDPFINPDAEDIPGSGIDANCDGIIPCSSLEISEFIAPYDPVNIANQIIVQALTVGDAIESATWEWGDGAVSSGIIQNGSVTGSHYYHQPGVYTITLYIDNDCAQSFTYTHKYVVVYDPSAGFVTGSGTIFSPPGASTVYPEASGNASFGFVSRYDKNKMQLKGNTAFEFAAGGLNFRSTEYEWLVVAGSSAKFKGRGKINDTGNYQFMISAEDGALKRKESPDKLRMVIWDEISGNIIYDNEMNSSLDSEPATEILEGSIVIHVPKLKSGDLSGSLEDAKSDLLTLYPNPARGIVKILQNVTFDQSIELEVYNNSGILIMKKTYNGRNSLEFDMSDQASGMYLVNMIIGNERFSRKLVVQ
jgi:PKD repeat protein